MNNLEQLARRHRESRRSRQHRRPRAFVGCAATEFARVPSADFAAFLADNLAVFSTSAFATVTCLAAPPTGALRGADGSPVFARPAPTPQSPAANFAAFSVSDFVATYPAANPTGTLRGAGGSPVFARPAPTPQFAAANAKTGLTFLTVSSVASDVAQSGTGVSPVNPQRAPTPPPSVSQRVLECGTSVPLCEKTSVSRPRTCHTTAVFFLSPPLVLALVLSLFFFFFSGHRSVACGLPTALPQSPFMGSQDYRFNYWESWGEIKVSPTVTLKIPVGFSPVQNHSYGQRLGAGWSFPLLESTCYPISDRKYEMRFPTGHRQTLEKKQNSGKQVTRLEGGDWIAEISKGVITAKSKCGWVLIYESGQLRRLRTPNGSVVVFLRDTAGSYFINVNGKNALTWNLDFDPVTTRKVVHLTLRDGTKSRHALLRFGSRLVSFSPRTGASGEKQQRKEQLHSLVSIKWDGEPERRYDFGETSLSVGGHLYQWEQTGETLLRDGDLAFSSTTIHGVRCLKTTNTTTGKTSLTGRNKAGKILVSKQEDGPIVIREFMPNSGVQGGGFFPKRIWQVDANGEEKLIRQYWYGADYNVVRLLDTNEKGTILYTKNAQEEAAQDYKTKEIIWKKKFDDSKRLSVFEFRGKTYNIEYLKDGLNVKLMRTIAGETTNAILPITSLNHFFPKTPTTQKP